MGSVGAIAGSLDRSKTSSAAVHFSALCLEVSTLSDPRNRSRNGIKNYTPKLIWLVSGHGRAAGWMFHVATELLIIINEQYRFLMKG